MTHDVAVRITDLHKYYGTLRAVDGVTLTIERGETFALLGPNGAGKSTAIEILEGYRRRTSGGVSVLGVDPHHGDLSWKARLGIVSQSTAEADTATVRELLTITRGLYPDPREVDEVIAAVGLDAKADIRSSKLSGGQRRRPRRSSPAYGLSPRASRRCPRPSRLGWSTTSVQVLPNPCRRSPCSALESWTC